MRRAPRKNDPPPPGPTLRQIDVFRCTMQLGTVSGAARALHISQPAVTQTLQQMEMTCGLRLFDRRRGRLLPTPEAQVLMFEVEQVHQGLDRVRQQIQVLRNHSLAQLRIGCLHALALGPVPRALAHFRARYPLTRIVLMVESSQAIRDSLAAGALDFGLVADEADTSGLTSAVFYEIAGVCLLRAAHPLAQRKAITPADLAGAPLIGLQASDRAQMRLRELFAAAGVEPNIVIETPYSATQCALVAAGAGIALVNPVAARDYASAEIAVVPFRPRLSFKALLVSHPGRPLSSAAQIFIAELRRQLDQAERAETK